MRWPGRIWRAAWWLIGGCGTLLMFGAQVGPDDAVSNLSKWPKRLLGVEVPTWLTPPAADKWAFWVGIALFGLAAFSFLTWRRGKAARLPKADALIPLATAVRQFGDSVQDVFASFTEAGAFPSKGVDGQMSQRAYRIWRIVPLQIKYLDSDKYKSVTMEERAMARIEFEDGVPRLVGPRETVSTDIAIKESDLQTAISRAPTVPPGGDLVPLKDAVKELYDSARSNAVVGIAVARKTEDEKLAYLAHVLWGKAPLQIRPIISNMYEPLFKERRLERYVVFQDGAPLLVYNDNSNQEQIAARDIAILRSNLDDAIRILRNQ